MIMGDGNKDEEHEKAAYQVTGLQGLKQICAWRFFSCTLRHGELRVAAVPRPV